MPWTRPYLQPAPHKPFLYYAVAGVDMSRFAPSRQAHRIDSEVPAALDLSAYQRSQAPQALAALCEGWVWQQLQQNKPALAHTVAQQDNWVILSGAIAHSDTLDYLRNAIGLVTALLDAGGVAVCELQSLNWWSAADWREQIFASATAPIMRHVSILISPEAGDALWVHTRGMRTFGRPDLSMHAVPAHLLPQVQALFERLINMQARGGVIPDGQPVRMQGLPDGLCCWHAGSTDDADFNNVHVEIASMASAR